MATSAITGSILDLTGDPHATSPVGVRLWLRSSEDFIGIGASAHTGGMQPIAVAADGSVNHDGIPETVAGAPMYRLHVESTHLRAAGRGPGVTSGWFALPAGGITLGEIAETHFAPTLVEPGMYASIVELVAAAQAAAEGAAGVAESVAEDRAYVEGIVITDLGTTDGITSALVHTRGSNTAAALDAYYASASIVPGLAFEQVDGLLQVATGTDPEPIDAFGGHVYGRVGAKMYRAASLTVPWTLIEDFALLPDGGPLAVIGVRELGNGEVLVVKQDGLWRSTGWASDPVTATWTKCLTPTSGSWFVQFGVETTPELGWIVATSYMAGAGDLTASRYMWLSQDNGTTFNVVFDFAAVKPGEDITRCHMHAAAVDHHPTLAAPRLFLSGHNVDEPPTGLDQAWVWASDDEGATWVQVTNAKRPTVIKAARHGVVMASDELPNAVYGVGRPASASALKIETLHTIKAGTHDLTGWGGLAVRDTDGTVYICFTQTLAGGLAPLVATDGVSAGVVATIAPASGTEKVDWHHVLIHGGELVASYTRDGSGSALGYYRRFPIPRRGSLSLDAVNSGGILDGGAVDTSLAAGFGSSSAGVYSVAVGHAATTALAATYSVAVGSGASTTGTAYGVALGRNATSAGGTSLGYLSTTGTLGVAVGRETDGGNSGAAVGYKATATGPSSVAIGYQATATLDGGVALGRDATAAASTVALGKNAAANHFLSIALGAATTTSHDDQIAVGPRHFEILPVAAEPPIYAGRARVYVRKNASDKMELCARLAGTTVVLATEA